MSDWLVCPACGSERFEQTRATRTTFDVMVDSSGAVDDVATRELYDTGERYEDQISCSDCGEAYDPESLETELVTAEAYAACECGDPTDCVCGVSLC